MRRSLARCLPKGGAVDENPASARDGRNRRAVRLLCVIPGGGPADADRRILLGAPARVRGAPAGGPDSCSPFRDPGGVVFGAAGNPDRGATSRPGPRGRSRIHVRPVPAPFLARLATLLAPLMLRRPPPASVLRWALMGNDEIGR